TDSARYEPAERTGLFDKGLLIRVEEVCIHGKTLECISTPRKPTLPRRWCFHTQKQNFRGQNQPLALCVRLSLKNSIAEKIREERIESSWSAGQKPILLARLLTAGNPLWP